ncbi:hypothetical protein [Aquimarina sediminis]|uniref:hypothetical protein n=1 Tax=Aquimarina sediminis TaxID=2070536 RepID=UPI0013E8A4DB|nr:hypothetical protein [Aquimarina sediminis]
MTQEELYQYMLAYQQEHDFSIENQSNFISAMETLKQCSHLENASELSRSQEH